MSLFCPSVDLNTLLLIHLGSSQFDLFVGESMQKHARRSQLQPILSSSKMNFLACFLINLWEIK